jgi:hypothetical protein
MRSLHPDLAARAVSIDITDDDLIVDLDDGRRLLVPLSWYPRLDNASPEQRKSWRLIGDGDGIHWPDLDEDLSVAGLLRGSPAPGGVTGPRKRAKV